MMNSLFRGFINEKNICDQDIYTMKLGTIFEGEIHYGEHYSFMDYFLIFGFTIFFNKIIGEKEEMEIK